MHAPVKFGKQAIVIVTGRRADALAELSAELADAGAESLVLVFDVRDRKLAEDVGQKSAAGLERNRRAR